MPRSARTGGKGRANASGLNYLDPHAFPRDPGADGVPPPTTPVGRSRPRGGKGKAVMGRLRRRFTKTGVAVVTVLTVGLAAATLAVVASSGNSRDADGNDSPVACNSNPNVNPNAANVEGEC